MLASLRPSNACLTRRALLCAGALAAALVAATGASAQALYMRVDGVKGENPKGQPLGPDAFALLNFSVSTDPFESPQSSRFAESGERFEDLGFTLQIGGPAVALWQLAAQRQAVPKASLVWLDPSTGAVSYRIDLEQVVVKSVGLQTVGKRSAAVGEMSYQRIRIRSGEDGPTASWDRAKNAPWK